MKKLLIWCALLALGYLLITKTNLIYNETNTFSQWMERHTKIELGTYDHRDDTGFIFSQDDDAIRIDYKTYLADLLSQKFQHSHSSSSNFDFLDAITVNNDTKTLYIENPSNEVTSIEVSEIKNFFELGFKSIRDKDFDAPPPPKDQIYVMGIFNYAMGFFDHVIIQSKDSQGNLIDETLDNTFHDSRDKI